MPKYSVTNIHASEVTLPPPLGGRILKRNSTREITTEAHNVDSQQTQDMIDKGLIRVNQVVENDLRDDKIEVPTLDMVGNRLRFMGDYSNAEKYSADDLVKFNGVAWVSLQPSINLQPTEGIFWTPLSSPTVARSVKNGAKLLSTGDLKTFTTPTKFIHTDVDGNTISVYHNGRKLTQSLVQQEGEEFRVAESGGAGTGWDTVILHNLVTDVNTLRVSYEEA